jgi:hypothetical protein
MWREKAGKPGKKRTSKGKKCPLAPQEAMGKFEALLSLDQESAPIVLPPAKKHLA